MDVYIFVHFIFEYILLKSAQMILREAKGNTKIMLAAIFTSISNALLLIIPMSLPLKYLITYVLVTLVEIKISFTIKTKREFLKVFILLYFLAFALGGCLQWAFDSLTILKERGYSIITLSAAIFFFCAFIRKAIGMIKENMAKRQCIKKVCLNINGQKICCQGLMDTGNSLTDPISQKPVLIIQKDELTKNEIKIGMEQYRVIPYHSIGKKSGILEGFIADEVFVLDEDEQGETQTIARRKVVIGIYEGRLSRDDSYQMILHPMF